MSNHHSIIYFIQDNASQFIKIGMTRNIRGRMEQLRTSAPMGITLLGICGGEAREEEFYHLKFSKARENGEWFRPVPSLLQFIKYNTIHLDTNLLESLVKMLWDSSDIVPATHRKEKPQWEASQIVEYSLNHLGGLLSPRRIKEHMGNDELTHTEAKKLIDEVISMRSVEHNGRRYEIATGRGNRKVLRLMGGTHDA